MTAVFKHELHMMFSSLTAYVYGLFSLLAVGIYMMYYNLSIGYANFEYVFAGASFALLIMIPIINPPCTRPQAIYWRAHSYQSKSAQIFKEFLVEYCKKW